MAHIRGHIRVFARNVSSDTDPYPKTGNFYRYILEVTSYEDELQYVQGTDSFGVPAKNHLLFLSSNRYLDQFSSSQELDLILKVQSEYAAYTGNWSLNNKNNWLVYDQYDQEHEHTGSQNISKLIRYLPFINFILLVLLAIAYLSNLTINK